MIKLNNGRIILLNGDCLHEMKRIKSNSIDMVFADLPYGTTACKWDTPINLQLFWYYLAGKLVDGCPKIIGIGKQSAAYVFTATQPFTTVLGSSNIENLKYSWVWDKIVPVGFQVAKYKPMMQHEDVLVFGTGRITYNPIKTIRDKPIKGYATPSKSSPLAYTDTQMRTYTDKNPTSIISKKRIKGVGPQMHPTQKPVELLEYLIRTYTNPGDTVLDPTMGSGTTGVACANLNRKFIGIEKDENYFNIAVQRIEQSLIAQDQAAA